MRDEQSSIRVQDVRSMARRMLERASGPLVFIWLVCCLIEVSLIGALPFALSESFELFVLPTALDELGHFATNNGHLLLIVLGIAFCTFFRRALNGPLHELVIQDRELSPGAIVGLALRRLLPVFAMQQVIAIILFVVAVTCLLIGLQFGVYPQLLAQWTFAPALWFAATRDWDVTKTLGAAVTVTRRHWLFIFGGQAVVGVVASWLNDMLQSYPADLTTAAPLAISVAFATFYVAFRFAEWVSMSSIYLAIDDHESWS